MPCCSIELSNAPELLLLMFAGLTNEYLINTDAPAALTYNDRSINENGHAALAFGILLKESNNFLEVKLSSGHHQ